jgi:hypothetical protein
MCVCVCVPSQRQEQQVWSIQKPLGRLDVINTFVIFPDCNVGLYSPRSETRNDTQLSILLCNIGGASKSVFSYC